MSMNIDQSLDEIIKKKRTVNKRRSSQRVTSGRIAKTSGGRNATIRRRSAPASLGRNLISKRLVGLGASTSPAGLNEGSKINISGLDFQVSEADLRVLFSNIGPLRSVTLNYDQAGRSKGTATVVFARSTDAAIAFEKYHNMTFDGSNRPMKIELVVNPAFQAALSTLSSAAKRSPTKGTRGVSNAAQSSRQGSKSGRGGRGGASRRGTGAGRGRGKRNSKPAVTSEELDKQMADYMNID